MRIGIAGAAAMNIMVLAVSLYQGEFTGIEPRFVTLFRWVSFALATPAVLYSATPIYSRAIAALRSGTLHIDIPIALGITLSYGLSAINTVRGTGEIYFDSLTTILFLLLASRHLHQRAFESSRRAFTSSWSLLPATVHWESGAGRIEDLPMQALRSQMILLVKPGERVPCDGVVESGESSLDCSAITGEALPVRTAPANAILAGSLNLEAPLRIRAATDAGASQLDRIVGTVTTSAAAPALFTTSFDTLSMIFTASALLLATGAFFFNTSTSWAAATSAAIAMLTVTCPCAVAFALPLLSIRALTACARRGILVSSAQIFEELPKVSQVFFDKTGTLTEGSLQVTKAHIENSGSHEVLAHLVLRLSQVNPSHPVSQALARWAQFDSRQCTPPIEVFDEKLIPSKGVTLTYACSDDATNTRHSASLVSLSFFVEHYRGDTQLPHFAGDTTVSVVTVDSVPVAFFELCDGVRSVASSVVKHFSQRALISILSGDRAASVRSVAQQLPPPPVQYWGELVPEQKAQHIREVAGVTLFVGDGANDGPALLEASVGVALRGGIQSLLECADVYITEGGIEQLITLDRIATHYDTAARRIVVLGLAYNAAGIAAALFGYVTPLVAAIAMPVFSSIVVGVAFTAFRGRSMWT
jgi:Cu2+-exporting ATPase